MAPLSLKIVMDEGAVTRTVIFDSVMRVAEALKIVKEKVLHADDGKDYGLFLTSADSDRSGIWLENHRPLEYYMLREGDSLLYLNRTRNLRIRMLDGSVKTLQVDESKNIGELMLLICSRIGITNHEEYGLCQEETLRMEDQGKPATGTLTLKRKAQAKDKDQMMEQLSKKFKTDDHVEWLDQHKTLREMGIEPIETLLLKRKLYFSDRNIDSRDPVQLNLLYVQTRNAILEGRHPVTEAQAMEFAAIQCQVHFGDFNEEKHKPGLIENLNEYLPAHYSSAWGAEKKILKLWRNHHGVSPLDAKYVYIKSARDLPTYGVTFFLVKEKQKGKKKLIPRLLGINAESILRLDEETKEILQTWPLTHIKSYHAGKKETFMLNFGDYSEKEYCVKTNDAYRIRDVLESYIDIIRKRMAAKWDTQEDEYCAIGEENIQLSKGHMITHGTHKATKLIEDTVVGPSQIISFEPGKESTQGTQIMTVQQLIITNKGTMQQQAVTGTVAMRSDMSPEFVKKLNRMNSNSVKIVTLLTEPTPDNVTQSKAIVECMEQDIPFIIKGVHEAAEKQTSEDAKKQLLDQLNELMDLLNSLSAASRRDDFNPEEVQDSARKIADLTTQMYFSMDPKNRRRSELVRKSRQSFIADERMEGTLRRASFINASASACSAIDDAMDTLKQDSLPVVNTEEVDQLEALAADRMAQLSAAIAHYLTAHSDPKNVDYAAAVTSMNTIKEIMPELAADTKAISSARDPKSRQELLAEMEALCEAAKAVCLLTGSEDHEKIQEAANNYADVSGKLVYLIDRRHRKLNADKDNEITDLSKEVVDSTTLLLVKVTELTAVADDDPRSNRVDDAGVICAGAARDLLVCAQLSAPTIYEAHCQSALTASVEHLSSAAQQLSAAWKPLVEDPSRHKLGEELMMSSKELAKAMDKLIAAACISNGGDVEMQESYPAQGERLRFITSVNSTKNALKNARDELNKAAPAVELTEKQTDQLQNEVSQKMAQINAAVASLLQAKTDPHNPDYNTAELAMSTISELMPEVIRDVNKLSSRCPNAGAREAMLSDMRMWCDGIERVCDAANGNDIKALDEAAKQFAKATRKLTFVFSPLANKAREQLLMELFKSAQNQALKLANETQDLADTIGGANGARLRQGSDNVALNARALGTAFELTAPTMHDPRCQSALLSTTESLADSTHQLLSETTSLQDDETGCRVLEAKLHQQRARIQIQGQMLQKALMGIKETLCDSVGSQLETTETPIHRVERLKFITSTVAVKNKMKAAQDLLDQPEPIAVPKLTEHQMKQLESNLGQNMVEVNTALARLIHAKSDPKNPDYNVAEEALRIISDIMPNIVSDTKTLSSTCEDTKTRNAMIEDLKRWCEAIQAVCDSAGHGDTKEFVDSAQNFVDTSNKLTFIIGPMKKPAEQKVLQLTATACEKAKEMIDETHKTSEAVGGVEGAKLEVKNMALHDAAQAFRTTAQLTAASMEDPRCQSLMISSTNNLSAKAQDLVSEGQSSQHPSCKDLGNSLALKKQELDATLDEIKSNCGAKSSRPPPPPVPSRKTTSSNTDIVTNSPAIKDLNERKERPPISKKPAQTPRVPNSSTRRLDCQSFLDHLRDHEETSRMAAAAMEETKMAAQKAAEENKLRGRLVKDIEEYDKCIALAEEELEKACNTKAPVPVPDAEEISAVQKRIEEKVASASAAAARLVASHHPDHIDYTAASESTHTLKQLMSEIVKDASQLSNCRNDKSRRLLDEIKALCAATRRLCARANGDHKELNEAAVAFGDTSARLLYVVSEEIDPAQEKEVLSSARSIGDAASRLGLAGAKLAEAEDAYAELICEKGNLCANAAGNIVYTAKLVAPAIHHLECQKSLIAASDNLSTHLASYQATWKPLSSHPQHKKTIANMDMEVSQLEKLLQVFREDLEKGKLVKKKEQVIVEDTALRNLAAVIMEDAKKRAESTKMPEDKRRNFAAYANKLAEAIRALDIANTRCKRAPMDINKRHDLENSVQNLQITVLQSRPALVDRPQNNIVDLMDFVKDVSSEAESLSGAVNETTVVHGKRILDEIKQQCHSINLSAFKLMNPQENSDSDGSSVEDILLIDQFGSECASRIEDMKSKIENLDDVNLKQALLEKLASLEENCNMLRFAIKSALATAESAALDSTLEDLTDLDRKLDLMLLPSEGYRSNENKLSSPTPSLVTSRMKLVSAQASLSHGNACDVAPALASYITEMRTHCNIAEHQERARLKEHLSKLVGLLKSLTLMTSTRVAMWQPVSGAELAPITQQILQEIESPMAKSNANSETEHSKILNDHEVNRLLLPSEVTVQGDHKRLLDLVQQSASQLSMVSGTVVTSSSRPDSLARSARTAVDVACKLAAEARGVAGLLQDHIQKKRIEDATQEMCFATYNLLKASEMVSQDPKNAGSKRRLMDACRALNYAVNKLARSTCGNKTQAECNEMFRSLQTQQNLMQSSQPACAMPYEECLEALENQQQLIGKLKTDEKMSREEFRKMLQLISTSVCSTAQYASHCSYLIAISEQHQDAAKEGLVDVDRLMMMTRAVNDGCFRIVRIGDVEQAKEEESKLSKKIEDLKQAIKESSNRAKGDVKRELTEAAFRIDTSAKALHNAIHDSNNSLFIVDKITTSTMALVDSLSGLNSVLERPSVVPIVGDVSAETTALGDDIIKNSKALLSKTQALVKEVKAHGDDDGPMTWVTFNTGRTGVLEAFDKLLTCLKHNGHRARLVAAPKEDEVEEEVIQKSFVQTQLETANKWLHRRPSKPEIQADGERATMIIIDMAEKMAEDLKDPEKEEMMLLISESKTLFEECKKKYDSDQASILMDHLCELRKCIERGVVTRVVEDFVEAELPLQDLELIADNETDVSKRKLMLERAIAELLAQLGRVKKTARFVADAGHPSPAVASELDKCSEQTELHAPMLVKAAQERISNPNNAAAVDNYKKLLAQYVESLSRVRDLCDRAVDPMDFVQTAGETMSRMKEDTSKLNDPQRFAYTSNAITILANRVITVSMSSPNARNDPELRKALSDAQQKLTAAVPAPDARASRLSDWRDTADAILRTTGEVESVLGGEHIFVKEPEPDQPIYNAALGLHASVREWSGRDNEIVATAKRMAVLMAKLADAMNNDKKRDLIVNSKSIVTESHEVARLARKLAHECTDVRIRTNLLQVCERIPTISGQLKMLTTVKGSSFGQQGSEEDKEAMNTLVGNAQNLMTSVQEVVKAAVSATVKISASQRGIRMKWVRKNYY